MVQQKAHLTGWRLSSSRGPASAYLLPQLLSWYQLLLQGTWLDLWLWPHQPYWAELYSPNSSAWFPKVLYSLTPPYLLSLVSHDFPTQAWASSPVVSSWSPEETFQAHWQSFSGLPCPCCSVSVYQIVPIQQGPNQVPQTHEASYTLITRVHTHGVPFSKLP